MVKPRGKSMVLVDENEVDDFIRENCVKKIRTVKKKSKKEAKNGN
jgi:hypothetical protein